MRLRQLDLFQELIVDNFAGGGGASLGIELALGAEEAATSGCDPKPSLGMKPNAVSLTTCMGYAKALDLAGVPLGQT
jgi:hypothetical protein